MDSSNEKYKTLLDEEKENNVEIFLNKKDIKIIK